MPDPDRDSRNQRVIDEFRANGGQVGGFLADFHVLLLTTVGARSGLPRTRPLSYLPDGDRCIVFAAAGGAPTHPGWYHNLIANPDVTVEAGTETFAARAVVLTGADRDALLERYAGMNPRLAQYQLMTSRDIPVIALVRRRERPRRDG